MEKEQKEYYQVVTEGRYGSPVLQQLYYSKEEAEAGLKDVQEMWKDQEFWIEQGTEYVMGKCRGCGTVHANMMYDAHGIETGNWCETCYDSDKYPYRKDKYPTMETHGYGDWLGLDDY